MCRARGNEFMFYLFKIYIYGFFYAVAVTDNVDTLVVDGLLATAVQAGEC